MSTCFAAYPESGKITVVDDFALATSYKVIYNGLPIVLVRGHRSRTRLVEVACQYRFCFGEKASSSSVSRMNRLSLLLPVYVAFDYAFAVSSHGFAIVSPRP